ncbi:hypothetical protein LCGC14_1602390 [marine sediment metagenome]|uniref:Uncharacterized protein n=1 Tax=marine sediment metagenome TaxID=412755 RepID=A0A0F9IXC6_9ZZZZ
MFSKLSNWMAKHGFPLQVVGPVLIAIVLVPVVLALID